MAYVDTEINRLARTIPDRNTKYILPSGPNDLVPKLRNYAERGKMACVAVILLKNPDISRRHGEGFMIRAYDRKIEIATSLAKDLFGGGFYIYGCRLSLSIGDLRARRRRLAVESIAAQN